VVRRDGTSKNGDVTMQPVSVTLQGVTTAELASVRSQVAEAAIRAGLSPDQATRLSYAVNEVVTNAIQFGDGTAGVSIIADQARIIVEVRDIGGGALPDIAAEPPPPDQVRGRGLWLARELCDEVTFQSGCTGNVVRLSASA